ncbi:MAG: type VI secretion system accessory protein TagJ [Betaproteobacteria bacterium]
MTQISLDRLFDDAKARVQVAPNDFLARSLLWQVFACRGEFDRARKQLDVMLGLDSSWAIEVQACHGLIDSELQRAEVFAGIRSPTCFGPPPEWFGALVAAVGHVAQGQIAAASTLLDEVAEAVPEVPGSIDGRAFAWICDGDARVMPVLEVVAQGKYVWVPWQAVRNLTTQPPTELRDRLWQRAMLDATGTGGIEVFLPVRYPAPQSEAQAVAARTDWQPLNERFFIGFGQKMLLTDADEYALLDVRELTVAAP